MTVPFSADLYQAVVPGGSVTFKVMFETFYGSGIPQQVSGVQVAIAPAGGSPVLGPTGTGVIADGSAYDYTWQPATTVVPGDYLVTWTATGQQGTLTYTQAVIVSQPPEPVPSPGVYATVSQYQAWSGDLLTPVMMVSVTLRRATEVIDRALIGAVYKTDANSMPLDPGIVDVFMRATCAQCQFMLANNDPANIKSQYASTSMGGVNQTRTASAQGQVFPPLAPQAAAILQTAGALPGAPLLGW